MNAPLPTSPVDLAITVDLVDDHDEVYSKWKSLNLHKRVLLHFDEHSDFNWISQKDPKELLNASSIAEVKDSLRNKSGWMQESIINREGHLGNFLYQVFEANMVREWYWIYPTPLWNIPSERNFVWKQLQALYHTRPQEMTKPKRAGSTFQTTIMGVKAIVTSLDHLPSFQEDVLVSLDVDYLTSDPHQKPQSAELERKRLPWIWPDEFVKELESKRISPSHVAIAHSVQGGYTPIRFKFFGETLKHFFETNSFSPSYKSLKDIFSKRFSGTNEEALKALNSDQPEENFKSAFNYEKAQVLYDLGKFNEAKSAMDQCRYADKEYSTKHSSNAPIYERFGLFEEARKEYKRMRIMTPDLLFPLLGEAYYLTKFQSAWQGLQKYEEVLKQDPHNFGAHFFMGGIYRFKLKKPKRALEAYHKALLIRQNEPNLLICIGLCHIDLKDFNAAKHSFREALKLGAHNYLTYGCLSKIYWKTGKRQKAWEMFRESVRLWIKHCITKLRGVG